MAGGAARIDVRMKERPGLPGLLIFAYCFYLLSRKDNHSTQ